MTWLGFLAGLWLLLACGAAAADAAQGPAGASTPEAARASGDSAQFDSALRVEVISCVLEESAVDVSEMLAIARAELAPHVLVRGDEKNPKPLLRVDACHDERLVLRLLSPEGPEQSVALHDVPPEHRPRVAALALAELVLTARTVGEWRAERAAKSEKPPVEQEPTPAPAPPPSKGTSSDAARLPDWNPPAPAPSRWARMGLGAEVRLFVQQDLTVCYGPRLFVRMPRFDVTLLALFSRLSFEYGEMRTGTVAANIAAHLWRSQGALEAAVSLGADLGGTWGRSTPDISGWNAKKGEAVFASAFAQASMGGALSDQAYVHAAVTAGYAYGVYARDEISGQRTGTMGAYVGFSASVAWLL